MKFHTFSLDDAKRYGIEEAILLYNISYWIEKNKANNKHFYNGHYWTYNSYKAFQELFPYMSESQIKRAINNLEAKKAIVSDNFNQRSYDKTKWYRLNHPIPQTILSNPSDENDQPIPNINSDINTNKKQTIENFENFWDKYNKKTDKEKSKDKFLKLSLSEQEKILSVVDLYVLKTPDIKYRKNPLTWLNGKCWEDDYLDTKPNNKTNSKPEKKYYFNDEEYKSALIQWERENGRSDMHDIQGHLL